MKNQTGSALIISVIFLMIMSLISVAAMNSSIMQTKITSNHLDREMASQAAESALNEAESWIKGLTINPGATSNGSSMVWTHGELQQLNDVDHSNNLSFSNIDWERDSIKYGVLTNATAIPGVARQPQVVIEEIDFIPDNASTSATTSGLGDAYYRITTRGTGGSESAKVILQTIIRKRW